MASVAVLSLPLLLLLLGAASAKQIPSFIQICKRSDPDMERCIVNSVNALREPLKRGIPEMGVPPLEPLRIDEMRLTPAGSALDLLARDIKIYGAADGTIDHIKADINDTAIVFQVHLLFPRLRLDADYEVHGAFLALPLNGKGPVFANATDVRAEVDVVGNLVKHKSAKYIQFTSGDINISKVADLKLRLERVLGSDKTIEDAINAALNENKDEVLALVLPGMETAILEFAINAANKICSNFSFDDLLPL